MKPTEITSNSNAQFKIFKSLLTSKGIKDENLFILSGEKLIQEFILNNPSGYKAEYVLFNDEVKVNTTAKLTYLSNDLFKELDVLGTHFNLLVISFSNLAEKDLSESPRGLEIICPLGDPRNLGSMIRTAVGFGVSEIILTSEATHPYLPHCLKASAGSIFKMKLSKSKSKIADIPLLKDDFALELHGTPLQQVVWPKNLRLWVGEEGPGLKLNHEQKKFMKFIHVPTENIESLNATISTSLALWEWKKQN